jgi:hypothetical protein
MSDPAEKPKASVTDLRKYREALVAAKAQKVSNPRAEPTINFDDFTWDGHAHPCTAEPDKSREISVDFNHFQTGELDAALHAPPVPDDDRRLDTDHELLGHLGRSAGSDVKDFGSVSGSLSGNTGDHQTLEAPGQYEAMELEPRGPRVSESTNSSRRRGDEHPVPYVRLAALFAGAVLIVSGVTYCSMQEDDAGVKKSLSDTAHKINNYLYPHPKFD